MVRFQTALITGATSGLGRELVHQLSPMCHRIVGVGRQTDQLRELEAAFSGQFTGVSADLSEPNATETLHRILETQGVRPEQVDLLVVNAGAAVFGPLANAAAGDLARAHRLNVTTSLELIRFFAVQMIAQRRGVIASVASSAAFGTGPLMSLYYADKTWLRVFSQSIDAELSPSGVSVLALCPGPFSSGFHRRSGMGGAGSTAGTGSEAKSGRLPSSAWVARKAVRAIVRRRRLALIGASSRLWRVLVGLLPWRASRALMYRLQRRRLPPA